MPRICSSQFWSDDPRRHPLLAVRWIECYGTAPPIEFSKLLHLIESQTALLADVHTLLQRKITVPEMGLSARVGSINAFNEAELQRLETVAPKPGASLMSASQLNELFYATLQESG